MDWSTSGKLHFHLNIQFLGITGEVKQTQWIEMQSCICGKGKSERKLSILKSWHEPLYFFGKHPTNITTIAYCFCSSWIVSYKNSKARFPQRVTLIIPSLENRVIGVSSFYSSEYCNSRCSSIQYLCNIILLTWDTLNTFR